MNSRQWQVHIVLLLITLIYGGNYVIAKAIMPEYLGAFGFILVRVAVALVLLIGFHELFIKEKVKSIKDHLKLALCAVFGVAANMLLFFKGLSLTSPINGSLIMTTTPVIVLAFAVILAEERINFKKVIGVILGAAGAASLILYSAGKLAGPKIESANWLGDLLIFLNATSYGIYLVIVRPLMKIYNPLTVIRWTFTYGLLFVFPFGINEFLQASWSQFPMEIWGGIAFVVVGTTFIAYVGNAWALSHVKSSIVGSYIYLQPVFATLIAVGTGNYTLTFLHIIFGIMIFAGVYLVSSAKTVKV